MQETAPLAITRLRTLWVIGHKVAWCSGSVRLEAANQNP